MKDEFLALQLLQRELVQTAFFRSELLRPLVQEYSKSGLFFGNPNKRTARKTKSGGGRIREKARKQK